MKNNSNVYCLNIQSRVSQEMIENTERKALPYLHWLLVSAHDLMIYKDTSSPHPAMAWLVCSEWVNGLIKIVLTEINVRLWGPHCRHFCPLTSCSGVSFLSASLRSDLENESWGAASGSNGPDKIFRPLDQKYLSFSGNCWKFKPCSLSLKR